MSQYHPLVVSGTTLAELQASDTLFNADLPSSVEVSTLSVSGLPYPAPFGWASATVGTEDTSERNFGHGSTISTAISNTNDISWDDTNKLFLVSSTGTYEVELVARGSTGSSQNIDLKTYIGGVEKHKVTQRVTTQTDSHQLISLYVGTATAGNSIYVTRTNASNFRFDDASILYIRRLL